MRKYAPLVESVFIVQFVACRLFFCIKHKSNFKHLIAECWRNAFLVSQPYTCTPVHLYRCTDTRKEDCIKSTDLSGLKWNSIFHDPFSCSCELMPHLRAPHFAPISSNRNVYNASDTRLFLLLLPVLSLFRSVFLAKSLRSRECKWTMWGWDGIRIARNIWAKYGTRHLPSEHTYHIRLHIIYKAHLHITQ